MKVVFLDIDGVLNSLGTMIALGSASRHWDRVAGGLLYQLCTKADASIVISSAWRVGRTITDLGDILDVQARRGLGKFVIGKTKQTSFMRGEEIELWLKDNPGVDRYIIIDDSNDMLEEQKPFFIRTSGLHGFRAFEYMLALRILMPDHPEMYELEKYIKWEQERLQGLRES